MTTDTPACVDALPFIDTTIDDDESQRDMAMRMIEDEMISFPPDRDYLENLRDVSMRPFLTERLQCELASLEENGPKESLINLSKIDASIPPPPNSDMSEEETALWSKCLDQIKIKLEYKQRQMTNLELIKTYGPPARKQFIMHQEHMVKDMQSELERIGAKIQEVNSQRKCHQEQVSRHLDVLQSHWDNLSISNQMLAEEIAKFKSEVKAK